MWLYYPYTEGDMITLSSIEFELAIAPLYEGVILKQKNSLIYSAIAFSVDVVQNG